MLSTNDDEALNVLYNAAANTQASNTSSSSSFGCLSADLDNDYLTFVNIPPSTSTSSSPSADSTTATASAAVGNSGDPLSLLDALVSPLPASTSASAASNSLPPSLPTHNRSSSYWAPSSNNAIQNTPMLSDVHSIEAFVATLGSASVPVTPAMPFGFINNGGSAATAPLSSLPYTDSMPPSLLDASTAPLAEALFSAYESYLNTPASVSMPQDNQSRLFAPLDELKSNESAATVPTTDGLLERLASADPEFRRNLVHALVSYIKPSVAPFQPVARDNSSASSLISQAQSLAATDPSLMLSPSMADDSSSSSLLGLLSPPLVDDHVVETASPSMLELFSSPDATTPLMLAPEDVFKTSPQLTNVDGGAEKKPANNKRKRESTTTATATATNSNKKQRFACDICHRGFSRQYNMRTHRLTHDPSSTAARPFKCRHCTRSFTRKHDMMRHQVLHDDTNAFKCKVCDRGFARTDVLERHIRAVHKDVAVAAAVS